MMPSAAATGSRTGRSTRTDRSPFMRRWLVFWAACFAAGFWCGLAVADLIVHVRSADGKIVASIAVPPGGYADVVERGTTPTPPGPQPTPTPTPPPNPNPAPAPVGTAKYFVLIRDDTPGRMTSAQLAA